MDYAELPASPPLNALVRCFWFLRGARAPAEPQVVVADGRLEIILHLGDPFARLDHQGAAHQQDAILVAGQLTTPIRLRPTGDADVVGIRFRTAAAGAVLGVPLAALTNRVEPLGDVDPPLARALYHACAAAPEPAVRVAALARVLCRAASGWPDALASALVRSLDAPHAPAVGQIADGYGLSARTVERKVLAATGLSPSQLRRVLRFRRAFRLLDSAPPGTGAHVAARAGYFDQAHLIRDFRRFAGMAPSQFFRIDPTLARAIMAGEDRPA